MANLVSPSPGHVTLSGDAAGVLVVSQDQNTITGIVNGDQSVVLERFMGPPVRYEMDGSPRWIIGFDDEGKYHGAIDNQFITGPYIQS